VNFDAIFVEIGILIPIESLCLTLIGASRSGESGYSGPGY
jgi:hypothetical protein